MNSMDAKPPGIIDEVKMVHGGGSGDWFPAEEIRKYTNVFLVQGDKLLLGYKKRGLGIHNLEFRYLGGKVEPNESTLDTAQRELQEEAGIIAPLEHAGTLLFVVPGSKWAHIDIFQWFNKGEIPFDNMWDTDRYWLPLLLAKRPFSGRADYEKKGEDFILKKWWFGINPNTVSQTNQCI
ncbi:hypothetical protein B0H17DRAFT_1087093 [Mycena rosella]|uniref:Nudix hydrolase domain-containing protein n=1 Tax=Mycena rosella TaxID=1033263 RepID=A0AAD7G973_MYCRO|nr:hypothetical protein B0H17DRAFT_1087093 [Mycena rosella]